MDMTCQESFILSSVLALALAADGMSLACDFGPLEYAFAEVADSAVR